MEKERTSPRVYHIHFDARVMPDSLQAYLESLGFRNDNFSGAPEGYRSFEPDSHMTRKTFDKDEFVDLWQDAEKRAEGSDFVGYMEGEFIAYDDLIDEKSFGPAKLGYLIVPFSIRRRQLRHPEMFRETEIHLAMDADRSDPYMIKSLLDAGFYGAYMRKQDRRNIILTAQGFRKDIEPLASSLRTYLNEFGGVVRGTLKEEKIVRYKLFGVEVSELPEVVDNVAYDGLRI